MTTPPTTTRRRIAAYPGLDGLHKLVYGGGMVPDVTFTVGEEDPAPGGRFGIPVVLGFGEWVIGPVAWCKDEDWALRIATVLTVDEEQARWRHRQQLRRIAEAGGLDALTRGPY